MPRIARSKAACVELKPICRFGISVVTLLRSVTCWRSSERAGNAVTASALRCRAWSRFSAVTTISASAAATEVSSIELLRTVRVADARRRAGAAMDGFWPRDTNTLTVRAFTTRDVRPVPRSSCSSASAAVMRPWTAGVRMSCTAAKSNSTCRRACAPKSVSAPAASCAAMLKSCAPPCAYAGHAGSVASHSASEMLVYPLMNAAPCPPLLPGSRRGENDGVRAGRIDVDVEGGCQCRRETLRVGGVESAAHSQRRERRIRDAQLAAVVAVEFHDGLAQRLAAELQAAGGPGESAFELLGLEAAHRHAIRQHHRRFAGMHRRRVLHACGRDVHGALGHQHVDL